MRIGIENLTVRYGHHVALRDVSLAAHPGEILGIIGPNGSGKSSLVKAMAGTIACEGVVQFEGGARQVGMIGYVPQDHGARAALTVLETVLLGRVGQLGLRLTPDDIATAIGTLQELGIADLASRYLGELSGGQRQLTFLAQALASHPRILLLDEPLSALDIRHQLEVMELVLRLTHERQLTTLIVLHDLPLAARYVDRVAALKEGVMHAIGSTADVLTPALISTVFGVAADIQIMPLGRPEIRNIRLASGLS